MIRLRRDGEPVRMDKLKVISDDCSSRLPRSLFGNGFSAGFPTIFRSLALDNLNGFLPCVEQLD